MTMPPMLVAEADPARRFVSGFSRGLSWFGMLIFVALAFVGPGWTALAIATFAMTILGERRIRRMRWELDAPSPEGRFRFGRDASRSVRVADLGGVVVMLHAGAQSRGIPITRPHEHWWLVGHDGALLGDASSQGLDPMAPERFGAALGVPFVTFAEARRAGALPHGLPWYALRPGLAVVVAIVVSVAVMTVVLLLPTYWA